MGRRILCTEIDSESEVHKQTHLKSMFTLCSRILRFPNSVQECNKSEIADCSRYRNLALLLGLVGVSFPSVFNLLGPGRQECLLDLFIFLFRWY